MEIKFEVTGTERKAFVKAVSEIIGWEPVYKGAPTFAYAVNNYIIGKDGTLSYDTGVGSDELKHLLDGLTEQGYTFERPDRLVIELPKDGFSDTAIANLEKLVESKATLMKKAIGTDSLRIEQTDETICFPWLPSDTPADIIGAVTHLITALCEMAKTQKRITAREKLVDNEKYAFRCFLLRLGFIGEEYKGERKILLSNLSGNGSFKGGQRKQPQETVSAEPVANASETHSDIPEPNDLTEALADAKLIHAVNASFGEVADDE